MSTQPGEGRDELVLDGPPLPAALDPDVAGAQPVAQREQGRDLPGAPSAAPGRRPAPRRARPGGESGRQAASATFGRRCVDVAQQPRRRAGSPAAAGTARSGRRRGTAGPSRCSTGQARAASAGRSVLSGRAPGARLRRRSRPASPSRRRLRPLRPRSAPLSLASISAVAELGEQAHLVVDRPRVAQDRASSRASARRNMRADGTVEQGDAVVGQARRRCRARWRPAWRGGATATGRADAAR